MWNLEKMDSSVLKEMKQSCFHRAALGEDKKVPKVMCGNEVKKKWKKTAGSEHDILKKQGRGVREERRKPAIKISKMAERMLGSQYRIEIPSCEMCRLILIELQKTSGKLGWLKQDRPCIKALLLVGSLEKSHIG